MVMCNEGCVGKAFIARNRTRLGVHDGKLLSSLGAINAPYAEHTRNCNFFFEGGPNKRESVQSCNIFHCKFPPSEAGTTRTLLELGLLITRKLLNSTGNSNGIQNLSSKAATSQRLKQQRR
jgi:hypothetical protein